MFFEEDSRLLITGGKEKSIKVGKCIYVFKLVLEITREVDERRNCQL